MATKHTLTPQQREALMGLAPFSKSRTHSFTPDVFGKKDEDKNEIIPKDLQPVFTIRPTTKEEEEKYPRTQAAINASDEKTLSELARKLVVGWKNIIDIAIEEELEFKADNNGNPPVELWEQIPPFTRGRILLEAIKISGLQAGEKLGLDF